MTWPVVPALLAGLLPYDAVSVVELPYLTSILAAWLVGVLLTWRAFEQLSGWAFLGLGTAMAWSAFVEEHALRTDDARLAAFADSSWIWWFVFLSLALQLTPPGASARSRFALVTLVLGIASQSLSLVRSQPLARPFEGMESPWAIERLDSVISPLSWIAILGLGGCVLGALYVLFRSWRVAESNERRQLLWLIAGAVPLVPAVLAAYLLSYLGYDYLAGLPLAVAIMALAGGAALSVLKYRLYDVERVVTDSAAYALASGAVIAAFGLVIVVIGRTTPLGETSQLSTISATLIGVVVARQSYIWARRAVDRRLNRTRFDAIELLRRELSGEPQDLDLVLGRVLNDDSVRVLYPTDQGGWVTAGGQAATPGPDAIPIRGALVEFDPDRADPELVRSVVEEAAAEIENVSLRADLARQIEVVTDSRARLATAHVDERRRLERNLHDGAQQRLLALALQLRAAEVNGDPTRLRDAITGGIEELQAAVVELRELANGLHPAALDGGLRAAFEELASRFPVELDLDGYAATPGPEVEATAWFIACEAVSNAVKHASASRIVLSLRADDSQLTVRVEDDGRGHALPAGSGLRGIADRAEAAGGSLSVDSGDRGTVVTGVLPCGS